MGQNERKHWLILLTTELATGYIACCFPCNSFIKVISWRKRMLEEKSTVTDGEISVCRSVWWWSVPHSKTIGGRELD
jgi:hypothetical protein